MIICDLLLGIQRHLDNNSVHWWVFVQIPVRCLSFRECQYDHDMKVDYLFIIRLWMATLSWREAQTELLIEEAWGRKQKCLTTLFCWSWGSGAPRGGVPQIFYPKYLGTIRPPKNSPQAISNHKNLIETKKNIAEGTTNPRVEFSLPK